MGINFFCRNYQGWGESYLAHQALPLEQRAVKLFAVLPKSYFYGFCNSTNTFQNYYYKLSAERKKKTVLQCHGLKDLHVLFVTEHFYIKC